MNNLEQLVPPPKMCREIPEGAFADSALVWTQGIDGMFIDFRDALPEDEEGDLPAPTLVEILKEGGARMEFEIANLLLMGGEHADTITDSALEAWLDIQKEKQEQPDDAGRDPFD